MKTVLFVGLIVVYVLGYLFKYFKLVEHVKDPEAPSSGATKVKFNFKPVGIFFILAVIFWVQPYNYTIIEAGYKGIRVNLMGDQRGASNIKDVSGFVIYNTWSEEIHQIPLDLHHIAYKESKIIAKGGFPCDISPTFNYAVKPGTAADMFTNLRTTYKAGGLKAIEQGWLNTSIIGAINDVANRYVIDSIFNNREQFEAAIVVEANKRVSKWFEIQQLKTNIEPPGSIKKSIEAKATAIQDALTSEAQASAAVADQQRRVALARADSAEVVIKALAEAKSLQLKQEKLTPLYIEYMKIQKWDGVLPTTNVGSGSQSLINIK